MPLFHYVGLNKEQKQLSGVIDATDEASAQIKLRDLGIIVIKMNAESAEDEAKAQAGAEEGKSVFEFEALDKTGKKVVGTIVGDAEILAYKRLVEEYELQVTSLVDNKLPENDKAELKAAGLAELQKQYEATYKVTKKKETTPGLSDEQAIPDEARKTVMTKVDLTVQKIQNVLEEYGQQMKPDERSALQGYLNQLARIKDSSNLDHVVTTSKRMLQHVQEKELFTQEDVRDKAGLKIRVETGELLKDLKKSSTLAKPIKIDSIIDDIDKKPFLQPIAKFLRNIFPHESAEMREIKLQIKAANSQILEYLKVALFGKTQQSKSEAMNSITSIRAEKKRLKAQLSALKDKDRATRKIKNEETVEISHHDVAQQFFGWMLFVYLFFYIVTYPLTMKVIPNFELPSYLYFYDSGILKALTLLTLIGYACVSIHNFWLTKQRIAALSVYGIGLFGFLLIAINLL